MESSTREEASRRAEELRSLWFCRIQEVNKGVTRLINDDDLEDIMPFFSLINLINVFFLEWGWILIELGILMNRLFSFWLLFERGQGRWNLDLIRRL
jgi:hypothetical protein